MKYDFAIIGSGIIGLTLAFKLKQKFNNSKIVIFEKEPNSISHGSGRNSGVLHSGIYYEPGSLRANLCVTGVKELKEYIKSENLWINECGKLLLPTSEYSYSNLENLFNRAKKNGVEINKIKNEEIKRIEPNTNCKFEYGLHVPFTSVADPREVSKSLIENLKKMNVEINYNSKILKISEQKLFTQNNTIEAGHIFNCAGLFADEIAKNSNLEFRYSFLPFKGKYWKITKKSFKLNHLVYPIPDLRYPFLGLHSSHNRHGDFYIGPSSTPVFGREQYNGILGDNLKESISLIFNFSKKIIFNENKLRTLALQELSLLTKRGFFNQIKKMFNNVNPDDLELSDQKVGIRSQIFDPQSKNLVNDFVVINQKNTTHVLNAISPAWSASFAFADHLINEAAL
ncbi:MAG: L-2-hydroxyglutarate oxidase [Pelagibacteraceae bacterium]|nr:L-2-hydroxyglutarate oxidase [Pelagibacteraceae bacterium]MCI5080011.1 L-2-hydroxyglutarate oxidase [Pelagibacteraceae bacterium]